MIDIKSIARSQDPRRIDLEGRVLVAHQAEFMPWLGNVSKAAMGDVYVVFDNAQFEKRHWQNKNKIRVKNSEGYQWLTIPVKNIKKHLMPTNEVRIADEPWKRQHLKAIELSYKKAKYFDEIFAEIKEIYSYEDELLIDFLLRFIKHAFHKFSINVPVYRTSELILEGHYIDGKKSNLIINMCKVFDANNFVFGVDGRTYIDKNVFVGNNVNFVFQDFIHPIYKQMHGEFLSHMSYIDLLFNYGPDAINILGKSNYLES